MESAIPTISTEYWYIQAILSWSAVMDMQVETTMIPPDIAVVLVSGDMTFEETGAFGGTFGFATRALLARGAKKVILDLSGVKRIDSVGGMTLVQCFFAARESDAGCA